jgi:hypothetical protein
MGVLDRRETGDGKGSLRALSILLAILAIMVTLHMKSHSDSLHGSEDDSVISKATAGPPLFDGFLKVFPVTLEMSSPRGRHKGDILSVMVLTRPGHNSSIIAPITLDTGGKPGFILKDGDTRPAAVLRGEPYVATGMVAGSIDQAREDGRQIAVAELAEEIGARPLSELMDLGLPSPTMCVTDGHADDIASTESDQYYMALVDSRQERAVTGDGGGMEVADLMKRLLLPAAEAIRAMDGGFVREGGRARVCLSRALDAMGFIPELDAYIFDMPESLKACFTTCGLGNPVDPRKLAHPSEHTSGEEQPAAARAEGALRPVNDVDLGDPVVIMINEHTALLDLTSQNIADYDGQRKPVNKPFRNQILHASYDRVKIAIYYRDREKGPFVLLDPVQRPVLAAKLSLSLFHDRIIDRSERLGLLRIDLPDIRIDLPAISIERGRVKGGEIIRRDSRQLARSSVTKWLHSRGFNGPAKELGGPVFASPGQSDLRYSFYASEIEIPADSRGYMPLSEALRQCRAEGAGDAHTEVLLLRLASELQWIPSLGMSVIAAKDAVSH